MKKKGREQRTWEAELERVDAQQLAGGGRGGGGHCRIKEVERENGREDREGGRTPAERAVADGMRREGGGGGDEEEEGTVRGERRQGMRAAGGGSWG
jgi:hypothetical protein